MNPENFLIQTGSASDLLWQGTWNKSRDVVSDKNLKNHIDYMGDLDLFPAAGATHNVTVSTTTDTTAAITVDPSVSPSGSVYTLEEGKAYTFTATPSSKEYVFDNWTYGELHSDWVQTDGNKVTVTIPAGQTLTSPTIIANFKSNEYSLTVNGDNGTVSVEDSEGSPASAIGNVYTVYGGETYTLSATAGTGYKFSNWASSEITSVNSQSTNPITFTMPTNNAAVTANFTQKTEPSITGQPSEYDKYKNQDITYTFDPGDYTFEGIEGLTESTHYTVSGNTVTILATYLNTLTTGEKKTFTFNFSESKTVTSNELTISNSATATTEISKVSDPTDMDYTYPETLNLDGLEFTMTTKQPGETDQVKKYKFEGTDWKTDEGYSDPATDSITLKFDTTDATQGMVMKQAQNGAAITIAKDGATSATTGTFTVNKKAITITSNLVANSVTKTYDGDNTVDGLDTVKNSLSVNGAENGDSLSVDTITAEYNDKTAGSHKTINVSGIAISGTNTGEYSFSTTLAIENAGQIDKKNLTVTGVTVPAAKQFETVESKTVNDSSDFTTNDKVSGDNVTLTYNYQYSSTAVAGNNTINVTVTPVSLGGADGENYQLNTSPIAVKGTVTADTLTDISLSVTDTEYVHGETIDGSQIAVTLNYTTAGQKTYTGIDAITGAGIELKWTDDLATEVTDEQVVRYDTFAGKGIKASFGGKEDTQAITVTQKELIPTIGGSNVDKTYDQNNIVTDTSNITVTINDGDKVGSDVVSIDTDGISATYPDENADTSAQNLTVTGYTLAGYNAGCYTLGEATGNATGQINKKDLAITAINNIPAIGQYTQTLTGSSTATQSEITSDILSGDEVTVSYDYEYTSSQTSGTVNNVNVSNIEIIGGADKDNYNLTTTTLSEQAGTVTAATIDYIEVKTQPVQTVDGTKATHGDTIDLSALEITVHYVGGASNDFAYSTFGDNNIELTWTKGGAVTGSEELRYDTHNGDTITVTLGDKTTTTTNAFIVDQAELTASVSKTGDITKVYDKTNALAGGDKDKITVTLNGKQATGDNVTATFEAVYADVNVNASETINVTNIAPTGTGAENYTVTPNTDNSLTGAITQRPLTVSITSVPSIFDGDPAGKQLTEGVNFTVSNKVSGDDVTVTVTGTYSSTTVGTDVPVTYAASITGGTSAGNYSINAAPKGPNGTVLANGVKTIVINNQPNKTEYTHGDKLDLNGLEFTTTTNDNQTKKYKFENGNWVSGGEYSGDPADATGANAVSVLYNGEVAKHDTTVVRKDVANNSIFITGGIATESTLDFTVNAKTLIPVISGSDIDKYYDGNANASVEAVTVAIKDQATAVVSGDDVSINKISAEYPDENKDDLTVNLTVNYELTGTHKDCYTLGTAEGNATGKINAKVVTINSISVPSIYVGATDLTVEVKQWGLADDDDLLLMANAGVTLNGVTATYPDANAAGEKTVIIKFDVEGNDKGNFTFATDPAEIKGEVKNNTMESFVVKTEPNMTYEYGDWFDFIGTVIEVTYTDGSKKEFTYDAGKDEFVNGSEELEYTAALKDKEGNTETINVDDQVDIADAGKTIEFTVTGITNSTAQTTGTMTVNKKKINEIHISATGETTKDYDATAAVNGTFAYTTPNVVGSDNVSFTGVTYVYANKNAGEDIAITFNTDNIAVSNDKYELADTVTYKYYQDGAEQAGGLTGDITKRTVNITGITAGTTTVGNAGKVQATATIGTEEDKTAMLTDGIVVSVFVTYADEDVTAVGTPDVDVSYEVTLDPNSAKDNYNFVLESLAVSGNVTDNKITGLEIVKEPAKTQYEYGEKLDLTGVEVKVTYNDDPDNTETFVFDGTKWAVGGVEKPFPVDITWNSDETNTPLDITNTTVTKTDSIKFTAQDNVSVTTVTDVTGEITVGNAQLTVVAEGSAVKVYDGTTAVLDDENNTITFKVTDKNGNVVSGVEVLADAVYASKDAGEVQITFSNIRFADETNSSKYTLPTEIASITGTINKRLLTLESITVPSVKKGASATVTATNSTSFKLADTSLEVIAGDTVKISYTAAYSSTATTGNNIAATIDNTTLAITADDNAVKNYELAPFTGTATGTVSSGGSSGGGGGGGLAISISITKLNDETNEYEVVKDDLEGVVGDKITLGYEFSSNPANKEVEWLTSDEKIATVDENGVVTFVGEGEVEITVRRKTSTSTKDTVTIKVTQPEATPTPEVTPEPTERPSLVDKEILSPYIVGYEDGAFGPERTISREEVAAIFARLLVNKINMDENYEVSFSDIPDTAWSKNYIGFLEDFGILNGYEDGTYRPYNSITRAEMAVIIAKVEGYDVSGTDMTTKFSDVDSGYDSWATQSIKVLTEDGVIEGYEDGTFRPGNGITRAETVSMINRILDAMEVEEIKVRPTDVTDAHWAYEDIIKAMNDRVLKDVAISNSPNGETEEN